MGQEWEFFDITDGISEKTELEMHEQNSHGLADFTRHKNYR